MGGTEVSGSQSDHLEVDDVEEFLSTLGSFGIFPGMGAAEHIREFYWVDSVNGSDANDGSTGALAKATIDAAIALTTANQDDIILVLKGDYNENVNTGGVLADVAGIHLFGLGQRLCTVDNSNGAATAVFTVSAANVEIAGFFIDEQTASVEGIKSTVALAHLAIHDNYLVGNMENGISGTLSFSYIYGNEINAGTNDGIELTGSCVGCRIFNNQIYSCGDNGIHINSDDGDTNFIYDNTINGDSGDTDFAISITLGDNNKVSGNTMGELATWPILDSGSSNIWVNNHADVGTGSFTRVNGDGVGEDTGNITNIDLWTTGLFEVTLSMRVATDGTVWEFRLYEKTDTANFEVVDVDTFTIASDVAAVRVRGSYEGGDSKLQVGHITSVAVGGARTINYKVRCIGQ